jgi:TolB protein
MGDIAFGSGAATSEIWSLPIDANQGKVIGNLQRLTEDAADDFSPHLSADGQKMVFSSTRSGSRDLWIRDMSSGRDRSLVATPASEMRGRISPDGSRVVYESFDAGAWSVHLVATEGGAAERLCDGCSLMDYSSDGRRVVLSLTAARGFDSIDVVTRQRIEILRHPKYPLHRAAFSPDNQWLAMNAGKARRVFACHCHATPQR